MASINDIQIKSLKHFRDHEGAVIAQGNVYYKGKKLGFWSQDAWGGPDTFGFDENVLDDEVENFKETFDRVPENLRPYTSLESLLYELVNLMDIEKDYKKGVKKGFKSYVYATDGFHVSGFYHISDDKDVVRSDPYYAKFIKECERDFFRNAKVEPQIYSSSDDFIWVYRR